MDDYSFPDAGGCTYASPPQVLDPYAESYNYCTMDPVALMIRKQREDDERYWNQAEPNLAWGPSSGAQPSPLPDVDAPIPSRRRAPGHNASPAEAALAAGQKYYYLPGEPRTWRRPVSKPSGEYDVQWWKMFANADEQSMLVAKWLGYVGARDADGWIRPTRRELLKMGPWQAQRYAFYYAAFAREFGLRIPLWIKLLSPLRACTPVDVLWA